MKKSKYSILKAQELKIPFNRRRYLFPFSGGILLTALSILFLISPSGASGYFEKSIGLISLIFFGGCALILVIRFADPRPGLIINNEGILENTFGGTSSIPWKNITGFSTCSIRVNKSREDYIIIQTDDEKNSLRSQSLFKKIIGKLNAAAGYFQHPVYIHASSLKMDPDELLYIMKSCAKKFHNQYKQ